MEIINLTPHPINVITGDDTITYPTSGNIARCQQTSSPVGNVNGIPLEVSTFGDVQDLPDPQTGTVYIVSALVRTAVPTRNDIVSPNGVVRNEDGQIIGCSSFAVNF